MHAILSIWWSVRSVVDRGILVGWVIFRPLLPVQKPLESVNRHVSLHYWGEDALDGTLRVRDPFLVSASHYSHRVSDMQDGTFFGPGSLTASTRLSCTPGRGRRVRRRLTTSQSVLSIELSEIRHMHHHEDGNSAYSCPPKGVFPVIDKLITGVDILSGCE
jgi:hypothetical protein